MCHFLTVNCSSTQHTDLSSSTKKTAMMLPVDRHSFSSKLVLKLPETTEATHSEPWTKPALSNIKPDLKQIQTLEECIHYLKAMAKEVEHIKRRRNMLDKDKGLLSKATVPLSEESSKNLILSWAKELDRLNMPRAVVNKGFIQEETSHRVKNNNVSDCSKDTEKIMKWARELQMVTENMGLKHDDIKQILNNHIMKETTLSGLLPFLQFVVWSLLSCDSEEDVSKIWLTTNQRTWKSGNQKYIPDSVWQWIQSASVDVRLDPSSCNRWLSVSEDNLEVHERKLPNDYQDNHEQFDETSCVLGLTCFTTGRYYWEILVPTTGSWRLGVAATSAPRKGRFKMIPRTGYWTIWKGSQNLWACTDPYTKLSESVQPEVVGVYVDYQEGQVSFYDAKNRFHIYTFIQIFEDALLPVFVNLDGRAVLKIQNLSRFDKL